MQECRDASETAPTTADSHTHGMADGRPRLLDLQSHHLITESAMHCRNNDFYTDEAYLEIWHHTECNNLPSQAL